MGKKTAGKMGDVEVAGCAGTGRMGMWKRGHVETASRGVGVWRLLGEGYEGRGCFLKRDFPASCF